MAATIITVTRIGTSGTSVKMKINDTYSVPDKFTEDSIQSFRTWARDNDHIFIWTNDEQQEVSMIIPLSHIGWVTSAIPTSGVHEHFCIDVPCEVTTEAEITL